VNDALPPAEIHIDVGSGTITGDLAIPSDAAGMVAFAHGSGSSRHSRRNRQVATSLHGAGFGTLLMDLLTSRGSHRRAYP
jgi:putative phosphoribosyl transferase